MLRKLVELAVWICAAIIMSWAVTEPPAGGFDRSVDYPVPLAIAKETGIWFYLDRGWRPDWTRKVFETGECIYE